MKTTVTEDGEVINENAPYTSEPVEGPFWKTPWNHDREAESNNSGLACGDKSKTQQQFAKDADINVILAKFLQTGEMNLTGMPVYQDIDDKGDLQDQIVTAYQVEQAWNELPTAVRNILKDPRTFVEYVDHCVKRGDLDPLRELGLATPEPPQQANGVSSTDPPETAVPAVT